MMFSSMKKEISVYEKYQKNIICTVILCRFRIDIVHHITLLKIYTNIWLWEIILCPIDFIIPFLLKNSVFHKLSLI
jgi:hypothetical protein